MADRPRVTFEKSRVEKRRLKQKKERAEKEAKAREERKRLGLPDPNAPKVPASQPLLNSFIKQKKTSPSKSRVETRNDSGNESDNTIVGDTVEASDFDFDCDSDHNLDLGFGNDVLGFEDEGIDDLLLELGDTVEPLEEKSESRGAEGSWVTEATEGDEFSDCSFIFDEDIMNETEAAGKEISTKQIPAVPELASQDSFADDTAMLLEEFGHEFNPGSSFDGALLQLDGL
ncbi:hypothetical protein BJX63DRAFT_412764 [Aspergillus granulosus]|uniref:Uncharacterized protein n=1 Tax=Aspergillus granulosus TaxID=176169 RepID=A0ABR4GVV6_9EURO